MEHSSPLAAMQPPSVLFGHCFRSDATSSCGGSFGGMNGFGPNSFNFKDLSMKKSHSDYFSVKPISGSSPAASLAADLSQNFHIDKRSVHPISLSASTGADADMLASSPQVATPRRSLFSTNRFGADRRRGTNSPWPYPLLDLHAKESYRRDDDDSAIALLVSRWIDGHDGDVSSPSQGPL